MWYHWAGLQLMWFQLTVVSTPNCSLTLFLCPFRSQTECTTKWNEIDSICCFVCWTVNPVIEERCWISIISCVDMVLKVSKPCSGCLSYFKKLNFMDLRIVTGNTITFLTVTVKPLKVLLHCFERYITALHKHTNIKVVSGWCFVWYWCDMFNRNVNCGKALGRQFDTEVGLFVYFILNTRKQHWIILIFQYLLDSWSLLPVFVAQYLVRSRKYL